MELRVAIFETGYAPVTSVGTVSSIIFNSGSVSTGSRDVTVINQGPTTCYVNGGSAAASAILGVPVAAGQQLTLQGGTAITLWANTQTAGTTTTVQAGLGTLVSVV